MTSFDFTPLTYDDLPADRRPSLGQALVPVLGLVVFLGVGSGVLKLAPHGPLLWSIALTGLVGRYWLGYSWDDLYDGLASSLLMGLQAILILFTVYALIATWVSAGTIPAIMYYGLGVLTPQVFLPVTAILAGVVAFAIGSSWTTAGTLGVAFVGIGHGLGIPAPMTAGAILSGAYAGDKQSPLSDTTNLAAAVTNTDLYDHIDAMQVGTLLALGGSVIVYAYLGLRAGGAIPHGQVHAIRGALAGTYTLGPLVFAPLAVTFALALYGIPALPTLVAGVVTGTLTTILVQGASFTSAWKIFLNGTTPATGMDLVNHLLAAGGVSGSAWTVSVVVLALALGGLLERTGVLAVLARELTRIVWSRGSLVAGTGVSAFVVNALSAQQYMSIVIPGMSLRTLYDDYDLDSANLSRAVEAAGTPTGALLPWHAGGVYMAGVLGVPTLTVSLSGGLHVGGYAPYYLFAFLSPLFLFVMAATGWRLIPGAGTADTGDEAAGDAAATAD